MATKEPIQEPHVCPYCGLTDATHRAEACLPEPYGAPDDFGWTVCHGCERMSESHLWSSDHHEKNCPMKCIKPVCLEHGKLLPSRSWDVV